MTKSDFNLFNLAQKLKLEGIEVKEMNFETLDFNLKELTLDKGFYVQVNPSSICYNEGYILMKIFTDPELATIEVVSCNDFSEIIRACKRDFSKDFSSVDDYGDYLEKI